MHIASKHRAQILNNREDVTRQLATSNSMGM
jgi:hypothetical protein